MNEFKDAIKDLNILNVEIPEYNVEVIFSNGQILETRNARLNFDHISYVHPAA